MKGNVAFTCLVLLLAAGALAFRLPRLGARPMHADEAVQAARFRELWLGDGYVYDPHEFHGPTLSFATLPVVWMGGYQRFAETTEATYRLVPVLFAVGTILLFWLLADAIGKPAALCAALLTALSPAMVFYSRYYIHESMLVFFSLALLAAAWRYLQSGKLAWCLLAGACAGLVHATKETGVLVFAAMGSAWAMTMVCNLASPDAARSHPRRWRWWQLACAVAVAIVVSITLYSSFFTNLRGPLDSLLTYAAWISRAAGESPHVNPWYFHLRILGFWRLESGPWWSEGLILVLAGVGFFVALLPLRYKRLPDASLTFVRWTAFYALLLTAAYIVIPYKTPWCLLGFLQPLIMLAGIGAVTLVRLMPTLLPKCVLACVLLLLAGQLAWQSYRASYVLPAAPANPYVYAQTVPDVGRLSADLGQLAQAAPNGHAVLVEVVWDDHYYWPLPWYLREFEEVGYWTEVPDGPAAPLVISSPSYDAELTKQLEETHLMTGYYGLRPNVLAQLWVRMDLWEAHLRRLGRL